MNHRPLIAALAVLAFTIQIVPSSAQMKVGRAKAGQPVKMTMTGVSSQDRMYVRAAAQINEAEIRLGRLAMRKGGAWAKAYGSDMVKDHTMAQAELKQIGQKIRVSVPSEPNATQKAVYDSLARKSGTAFDAAYRQSQIKGHQEASTVTANEIKRGNNSMVKNYATKMLPAIKMHLKMAQQKKSMTMQ